jgi:hypothetical protein
MLAIINAFWQIVLFRQGPEDLPDSQPLLVLACAAYVFVDTVVILLLYPRDALLPLLLVDAGFLALWSMGVLRLFGFAGRLRRTLIALFGSGTLLQLLILPLSAWPVFGLPLEIPLFLRIAASLVSLLWSVAVYGHVYARALGRTPGIGTLFSVIYFIVVYQFAAQWSQVN